jgi:medium-chain acyl-[acyl-carrier-protein] hydrolase
MTGRIRLFCLPYAGGSAQRIYGTWSQRLPDWIDVVPVELPGRGGRIAERPVPLAEALVGDVLRQLLPVTTEPYALFGHSLGAMLAFEAARRLEHDHGRAPAHLMVSGFRAPDEPHQPDQDYRLPDGPFRQRLRELSGTPREVLEHEELMDLLVPVLRADFAAVGRWRYQPSAPLSCPLTVFGGRADAEAPPDTLPGWRRQTSADCQVRLLPGHHFFVNDATNELLPVLADRLTQTWLVAGFERSR